VCSSLPDGLYLHGAEYEYSEFDRTNLIYHFSNLQPEMVAGVKEKAEIEAEEKQKAARRDGQKEG
jgi:hypothetical protein